MKVKEDLGQAYRLDQRINSDIEELGKLREMSSSISSPTWEERVQTSRNTDAPFVRSVFKIMELEDKINAEIDNLVELKKQIRTVIDEVANTDERMVLRYRYIHNLTWEQIGDELHADRTTVYRWHNSAINHVTMPENPIKI